MLRTLHVPARVAVGFTSGTVTGGAQSITTEDVHAWVEAWFPGAGWLPFDLTPLTDGRTAMPSYVTAGDAPASSAPSSAGPLLAGRPAPVPDVLAGAAPHPGADDSGAGVDTDSDSGAGAGIGVGTRIGRSVAGLLVRGVLAGITPLGIREGRRRRRLRLIRAGGPQAVTAAWEEVLAESADRGGGGCIGETVRATAQRLADKHALDEPGRAALDNVVAAVERSWYADGGRPQFATTGLGDNRTRQADRELCASVTTLRASLARCAPPSRIARLLPRSVLPTLPLRIRP